ncbi:recombinase family protein [Streptomyces sp. 769]|uniref:recombinase family protein n=1 Tax=Streptomyces sp. 769 TaxID=1262452 RepID=UPI00057E851E|nr:recombinase family protein [Streptomyces sp. 769]AJC54028.1 hypothetical protein GZL_01428 [Streptomyces sp. 769]
MRILKVRRISRDTETSSALVSQGVELDHAIKTGGHTLAGDVEDSTVSGAVNLDQRPKLGKWLKKPLLDDWDALMVTTQDRITRDDLHWWSFVAFVLANDKTVIVLDDPGLDLVTPNGRAIAGFKAAQAANYRLDVVKKKKKQVEHYKAMDFWPGGQVPYGYMKVKFRTVDNGREVIRWKLVIDPISSAIVREIWDRLVNKQDKVAVIRRDLNAHGILTPTDHQRWRNAQEGREGVSCEVRGAKWGNGAIRDIMTRHTLMGVATENGKPRMRDGLPVQWAEPILTKSEFDAVQKIFTTRKGSHRAPSSNPFLYVVYCPCGTAFHGSLQRMRGKDYHYLKCGSINNAGVNCGMGKHFRKEWVSTFLEDQVLSQIGSVEITEKTFQPGHDRTQEIESLKQGISNLTESLAHAEPGSLAMTTIMEKMNEYSTQVTELEKEPVVPARWVETPTGKTYATEWENDQDWNKRGEVLRKAGVRLVLGGTMDNPTSILVLPKDLAARAGDVAAGTVDPKLEETVAAILDEDVKNVLILADFIKRDPELVKESLAKLRATEQRAA